MSQTYDYLMKLLIIGDAGSGKSAILSRYVGDSFNENYIATCGVDFNTRILEVDGKKIKLQIWDTAGQSKFHHITSSYYRGTQGFLIVYDVTQSKSYKNISKWIEEVRRLCNEDTNILLVANKCDLQDRQISVQEGKLLASKYGIKLFEASAKEGINIYEAFYSLVKDIKDSVIDNPLPKRDFGDKNSANKFKVIFLGTSYAGKTSLIRRFKTNKFTEPKTTIGVEWECFLFPNCSLEIWDTAGQERHKCLTRQYLRGSHCCILVFDVTDRKSLNCIQDYKDMFEKENDLDPLKNLFILVGNKIDRVDDRVISQEEARNLLLSLTGDGNQYSKYFETSAATGIGVREIFQYIANILPKIHPSAEISKSNISLQSEKNQVDQGCCFGSTISSVSQDEPPKPKKNEKEKNTLKSLKYDKKAQGNDIYEQYIYPYHLSEFDDKQIQQIACDISVVALSSSGRVYTWGSYAKERENRDILYISSFGNLDIKIKHLTSSGSELTAFDYSNNVYINTLWGAPVVNLIPQKFLALKNVDVSEISCGENFSALCTHSGELFTWGLGKAGSLGHGSLENNLYPTKVSFFEKLKVKQVSCGEWHTLALLETGIVYSCGNNSMGQLGTKTKENCISIPQLIPDLSNIVQIGCGESYSMALNKDGILFTWGDPSKIGRTSTSLFQATTPTPVLGSNFKVVGFSAGPFHAGCVTSNGKLWMWGNNKFGQLGMGTCVENHLDPQECFVNSNEKIIYVCCGRKHTACIVSSKSGSGSFSSSSQFPSGFLYTFGKGNRGQLGNGSLDEVVKTPRKIDLPVEIRQVACGSRHTIALGVDNRIYVTGYNLQGELGIGSYTSQCFTSFTAIDPTHFGSEEKILKIFSYSSYNIAVAGQNVYSWGHHQTQMNTGLRQLNEVPNSTIQVACGVSHSLVLDKNGYVYSWGPNSEILGHENTNKDYNFPQLVQALKFEKITQISCGAECSFAISQKGQAFWWGKFGNSLSAQPVKLKGVLTNLNLTKVSCTHTDVIFLSHIGDLYRWKITEDETQLISSVQDKVMKDIACGLTHCLVLSVDGKVFAFGRGEYGQLGCGKLLSILEPQIIPALEHLEIQQIACGRASSAVLTNKNEVYCFGNFCNTSTPPTMDNEEPLLYNVPNEETNSSPTILSECLIEDFPLWGVENVLFQFTIIAQNELKRRQKFGGDIFRVLVIGPGNQIKAHMKDNGDGSYLAAFVPTFSGLIEVSIGLAGTNLVKTLKTTIFSESIREMDLKNRSLKALKSEYLELFSNLTMLDISYNQLEEIPKAVTFLSKLYSLNARHNLIKQIPSELGSMSSLKILALEHNPIEEALTPILKYNNIDILKSYIKSNKKNYFDWNVMSLIFRCCNQTIKETDDISLLFSISDTDRSKCIASIHHFLSQTKLIQTKEKMTCTVSKYNLDFGFSNYKVYPINTPLSDTLMITNHSPSSLSISLRILKFSQDHQISIDQTKLKLGKASSATVQVSFLIPYSSPKRIHNLILIDAEGYIFIVGLDVASEMHEVYSFDEIFRLVNSANENQIIAHTQSPIWKIKWRTIDICVKGIYDLTNGMNEVNLHRKLFHPSIVQCIGSTPLSGYNTIYILLEFMRFGTLSSVLESELELPWKLRLNMIHDIAKGVLFLHNNNVIHANLQTSGLLVSEDMRVKICDFGYAIQDTSSFSLSSLTQSRAISKHYMAPELLSLKPTQSFTKDVDTFSFGIILCEIFTRTPPYKDEEFDELTVIQGKRPKLQRDLFEEINLIQTHDLILKCLNDNHTQRPQFIDIVNQMEILTQNYENYDIDDNSSNLNRSFDNISQELNESFSRSSTSPNISPILSNKKIPNDVIMLRRVGQNSRGVRIYIPTSLEKLLELASNHLKLPVLEIWDSEEVTITDIGMIKPGEIYYGAVESDLNAN